MKRVIDHNVKVRVRAGGSSVDPAKVKMPMNRFEEIAVEEAIRLTEKGTAIHRPALTSARIVVAGGRGVGSDARLAEKLGGVRGTKLIMEGKAS